jgi:hypothetical protein
MDASAGFIAFFALTLAGLAATVVTGFKARVRVHIPCVIATVVLLGITIFFAEQLGERYDLESAGAITPVHLALAKIATASYLLPIASGVATLRNRRWRRVHLTLAVITLTLTVGAAGTGTAMLLLSDPLPGAALSPP